MQFDDDADLDTSEVKDVRGSRVPGGRATIGGGIVGLIALVLGLLFGVGPEQLGLSSGDQEPAPASSSVSQVEQTCKKGRDANAREDCRLVAVVNSTQDFWRQEFTRRGGTYAPASTIFFSGRVNTACGAATSAVGPFYCPPTGGSTWTWGSSTTCGRSSARAAAPSPRRTSSPTSTGTTSRI